MRDLLISKNYSKTSLVTLVSGNCLEMLSDMPDKEARLIITSPPYNMGKSYEGQRMPIKLYIDQQMRVIKECYRILSDDGSICWQVGNFVKNGEIIPLDIILYEIFKSMGLKLRNRIIWHFEHGIHCRKRFSGRYETILWFTKSNKYTFNLDQIRVPQKYPGKKYYKGPNKGLFSCNPLGKNPGDVWIIPNVKHNHIEKTEHPCQFPVELVERFILSLSLPGDLVLDPFIGTGTTAIAAILRGRRAAGADIEERYIKIANDRLIRALCGNLAVRKMGTPIQEPSQNWRVARPPENGETNQFVDEKKSGNN